jgi:hypothetical protein
MNNMDFEVTVEVAKDEARKKVSYMFSFVILGLITVVTMSIHSPNTAIAFLQGIVGGLSVVGSILSAFKFWE